MARDEGGCDMIPVQGLHRLGTSRTMANELLPLTCAKCGSCVVSGILSFHTPCTRRANKTFSLPRQNNFPREFCMATCFTSIDVQPALSTDANSFSVSPSAGSHTHTLTCTLSHSRLFPPSSHRTGLLQLVLYHLWTRSGRRLAYFRWREDICDTIAERWDDLIPSRQSTV